MFTPAYGSKSRRNVSAAMTSMQTSNAQAASYLATILETRPKDGTLDFPMADQATQTKVMQAFLVSLNSLNITGDMVKSNPDGCIAMVIGAVADVYSATPNELIRALLQGDYSTAPWKTQFLRAVANNIQSEAHDFALQLGEQDITLEQMAELKDRAQQMDNIRIVLHDTRIDLDEFDTGVYPTEKDRSSQEGLNMIDKLLATGLKRLSQVCTGIQRPVTTNLRYKHIEEYGL